MTFSHAVRYLKESDVAFLRYKENVLSQEMGNVGKSGVFLGQVGLQVLLCSLGQPAQCKHLSR